MKHIISNGPDCIPSTAPVQVKELTFSADIAAHDLSTKLKQVESWLEKKHHIRITLRKGRGAPEVDLVRKNAHIFSLYKMGTAGRWQETIGSAPENSIFALKEQWQKQLKLLQYKIIQYK